MADSMERRAASRRRIGNPHIGELQARQQRDEFRLALRALLMQPLMNPAHTDFPAVRRQADALREWFGRETGWVLQVEREGARLYKRPAPADLLDATRGLPEYDRRRYVLLCLACAVLERAEPQITLHLLGSRVLELAAEPGLLPHGFEFTLSSATERRELVSVCRSLLDLGVLQRVAGDEEGYVHSQGGAQADALYDIHRRTLAGMLAAVRGPSTWPPGEAPAIFAARLHSLVAEHAVDSDEARRTALRHALARRLLDDPVVYAESLDAETQSYFANQRGVMAARLCEATGLVVEQRAEGLALTDETGTLTDVEMPAEGTEAHVTLLVAEHLAGRIRRGETGTITENAVEVFLRGVAEHYGRYWRKSAREPGAELELTRIALDRLHRLQLIDRQGASVRALPAIARFALGDTELQPASPPGKTATGSLF